MLLVSKIFFNHNFLNNLVTLKQLSKYMNIIKVFITWIAITGMLLVNYLANSLPLNGYTTSTLSSFYPNLFVPDGLTFSIWGIIYLWLLVAAAFLSGLLLRPQSKKSLPVGACPLALGLAHLPFQ